MRLNLRGAAFAWEIFFAASKPHRHTRTVPYEGDNFANTKININISYWSLKLLKNLLEFFYANAKQEVCLKVKKIFKA